MYIYIKLYRDIKKYDTPMAQKFVTT